MSLDDLDELKSLLDKFLKFYQSEALKAAKDEIDSKIREQVAA